MAQVNGISVVDVGALVQPGAGPGAIRESVDALAGACAQGGFFYLQGHGLPAGLHERMFADALRFFALPDQAKMELYIGRDTSRYAGGYVPLCGETTQGRKDWHECLDIQPRVDTAGVTESPFDCDPALRRLTWLTETFRDAWGRMERLAYRLAAGIALGLDLPEDHFDSAIRDPLGVFRLAHYPAHPDVLPDEVGEGIGAHTDYGFLTIVSQDDAGGLEARRGETDWVPAPHRDGTLVVMVGKVVERWTNDRYRAAWHRVRIPRGRSRYSVSYFFEPGYNTVIQPLSACCGRDNPPRYEPCRFGDLLASRYAVSFQSYQPPSTPSRK